MNNFKRKHSMTTLSVRVPPKIIDQLETLSDSTRRTKSFLAAEAIENYLAVQAWQVNAIKKSLKKADSGKANFISHDKVAAWIDSWGTENELEAPL